MFKSTPETEIWSIDILCKLNRSEAVAFKNNAFVAVLEAKIQHSPYRAEEDGETEKDDNP